MARYVKCDDGKIYALTGGGINGSKFTPEYTIVELSWEQIEKSGEKIKLSGGSSQKSLFGNAFPVIEGGVQVEVRPNGGGTNGNGNGGGSIGGTNSCVVTCTEKYDGKSASQVKLRKECIESCTQNVNPKQRKIADGLLATCELPMMNLISCPDNSIYVKQNMSMNTALLIGVNSNEIKNEVFPIYGGMGMGMGGISYGMNEFNSMILGGGFQPSKKYESCLKKCSNKMNKAEKEKSENLLAGSDSEIFSGKHPNSAVLICQNECFKNELAESGEKAKKALEDYLKKYLDSCEMSIDFQLISCEDGSLFKKSSITKDEAIRNGLKTPMGGGFGFDGNNGGSINGNGNGNGGGSIGGGGTNGSVGF
jgi:hypothetical protein